jgi:hypothetical protein
MTERSERVDFQIVPGYSLEFYRFPDGEKRIGKTSALKICGLSPAYLSNIESNSPKQYKALQQTGYRGWLRECLIERVSVGSRGSSISKTMSLDDFKIFVSFAAFDLGKKPAQSIVRGLVGVALESIARQAFGESRLSLEEIRSMLCHDYAKTVDWRSEDLEDAETIDNHMIFLQVS